MQKELNSEQTISQQEKLKQRLQLRKPISPLLQKLQFQNKHLKRLIELTVVLVLFGLMYLALLRIDTEQANYAINDNLVGYFNSLNKEDYQEMRKYLYPTDNEKYLLDTMVKAKAIGVKSTRVQKIYPVLVNGDIAIVGFEVSTTANFGGEDYVTRGLDTFFYRKHSGHWYIAKPTDLADVPKQKLSDMIDAYNPIIKDNLGENIEAQVEYNQTAFAKLEAKRATTESVSQ